MAERGTRSGSLSRREWALVALGVAAWIGIGLGGAWFVHQVTRSRDACGGTIEARSTSPKSSPAPRNALQLLTGTGRCP
jgi:hypothetical protein